MNRKHGSGIVVLVFTAGAGLGASVQPESTAASKHQIEGRTAEARAAVQRALPYLARQTGEWIEQKKCTSCHQVPHSLWAMNEARGRGFVVDERLASWNNWSVNFVLEKAEGADGAGARADELYQVLLGGSLPLLDASFGDAGSDAHTPHHSAARRDRLLAALRAAQNDDGSWRAGGQLPDQKRAGQETDEVTTMWSLLALRSVQRPDGDDTVGDDDPNPPSPPPGSSLEHLVLRYLLSIGNGNTEQAALQNQILSHQNEDGGWGWLVKDPSDALATGQVLYALSRTGAPGPAHGREAVSRARHFLVRTPAAGRLLARPQHPAGKSESILCGVQRLGDRLGGAWLNKNIRRVRRCSREQHSPTEQYGPGARRSVQRALLRRGTQDLAAIGGRVPDSAGL